MNELEYFAKVDSRVEFVPGSYEGVRVNFPANGGDGWMLVRQSVHDPVLPVNFASLSKGGDKLMAKYLYAFAAKFPCLDVSGLQAFLNKD